MLRLLMVVLAAVSLTVAAARADDAAETAAVAAAMDTLNKAFEDEDTAKIRALMTADHTAIAWMYDGAATVDEQIALFPDIEYSTYDTTMPAFSLIADGAAMANYEISLGGTFRGDPLPSRVYVTQIWVKHDGQWLQRAYQETVIGDR
jgi:hypothetical protein